jgi:hypothetical protein
MGPPSYVWSVVDRIVVMRRIPIGTFITELDVISRSDGVVRTARPTQLCCAVTLSLFMQLTDNFCLLTNIKHGASKAYLDVHISLT